MTGMCNRCGGSLLRSGEPVVTTDLAYQVNDVIRQRDQMADLCGHILATLKLQRNGQPLTQAGIALDEIMGMWERRFQEAQASC